MIVRLRKLGRGSKIELLKGRYRRYNGFTVGEILEKGTPYYPLLGFIYYNKSELSFVDDVLEELRITGDYTIDKPNADEEMCDKWLSNQFTNQEQKEVGDRMKYDTDIAFLRAETKKHGKAAGKMYYKNRVQGKI